MTHDALAKALFEAFANGDADTARSLCAADLKGCQNGGPEMGLEAILQFAVAVKHVAPDFRYEDAVRASTDTGFVEEHRVRASFADGSQVDAWVCVVGEVRDGKITELREYFDPSAAAPIMAALSRS